MFNSIESFVNSLIQSLALQMHRVYSVKVWRDQKTKLWRWEVKLHSEEYKDTFAILGGFRNCVPFVREVKPWHSLLTFSMPAEWKCDVCGDYSYSAEELAQHEEWHQLHPELPKQQEM